jgi:hypothetical protein
MSDCEDRLEFSPYWDDDDEYEYYYDPVSDWFPWCDDDYDEYDDDEPDDDEPDDDEPDEPKCFICGDPIEWATCANCQGLGGSIEEGYCPVCQGYGGEWICPKNHPTKDNSNA